MGIMKESLIKITGTDNLYYDSETKQYKSRMHCPYCGKPSGCWCYSEFDSIPMWDEDFPNTYCSDRHFVLGCDYYNLAEIADMLHITVKPTMEEWNASKIVKVIMDDIDSMDWDVSGNSCEV